jgi:hypothetical protein
MTDETTGVGLGETIDAFLTDDLDIHAEPARQFAKVHPHADGTATLDEGWGGAYIETDTLLNLEGCR